jgi:hypothetical protein
MSPYAAQLIDSRSGRLVTSPGPWTAKLREVLASAGLDNP